MAMVTATETQDFLDSLTDKQLFLLEFTEGITVLEGSKGTGKTTAAVGLLSLMGEHFGMPAVCDFALKEEFGPYHFFDIKSFVNDLRTISEATKGDSIMVAERALDMLIEGKQGSFLDGAIILLDEAYKYLDCRNPHDKVTKLLGYWIMQIRHFRASLILVTPDLGMLDKRIHRQVDRIGRCYTDSEEGTVTSLFSSISTGKPKRMVFRGEKFWSLFNSWVLTPFRVEHMRVGGE